MTHRLPSITCYAKLNFHFSDLRSLLHAATDICIVCLSSSGLQQLLNICSDCCERHDLTFNPPKSMFMYFSTSRNKHCKLPVIYLGNCECQFVNEVKYLGVMMHSFMTTTIDVTRQTRKFYMQANLLLRNFRHCSDEVNKHIAPKCTVANYG